MLDNTVSHVAPSRLDPPHRQRRGAAPHTTIAARVVRTFARPLSWGAKRANADDLRRGEGERAGRSQEVLTALALLHLLLGVVGVVAGIMAWYVPLGAGDAPVLGSGIALILAVCASAALAYQGIDFPLAATCARATLVGGDVVAGATAVWLTTTPPGAHAPLVSLPSSVVLVLLLLGPLSAGVLFSPKRGLLVLAASIAVVVAATTLRAGLVPDSILSATPSGTDQLSVLASRVPWMTLALECVVTSAVCGSVLWCWSAILRSASGLRARYEAALAQAQSLIHVLEARQAGLSRALVDVEHVAARRERENAVLLQQARTLASITESLADGQLSATRHLDPTLYGPLAALAAALGLVAQRVALTTSSQARARQTLADKLSMNARARQGAMHQLERAIRQLSSDAEAIAAAFPEAPSPFASSTPRGEDLEAQRFSPLTGQEVARLAIGHAERSAQLIALIAQIEAHQIEEQQTIAQLARLLVTAPEPAADQADTITMSGQDVRRAADAWFATSAAYSLPQRDAGFGSSWPTER